MDEKVSNQKAKEDKPRRPPGRPKTPLDQRPQYTRLSMSMPKQAWKNLDLLASRVNIRARRGPRFDQPSWRSWLLRFALEDIPRIIALLDTLDTHFDGDANASSTSFHLIPDVAIKKGLPDGNNKPDNNGVESRNGLPLPTV